MSDDDNILGMDSYPARYSDVRGSVETLIHNDGEILRVTIRGIEFTGRDFDMLEPPENAPRSLLEGFSFNHNELCSCRIECTIPIAMHDNGKQTRGSLRVELILGDPAPNGWLDREELQITLCCEHGQFAGTGKSGWFEDELLEIQARLPSGVYMRTCINCLYSDYSPYGHGAFGCMLCFRNIKAEYLALSSKGDFWSVHNRPDRMVQETYLCDEFERRIPGTGYRG